MRGQDWFQWKLVAVLSLIVFYEQASSRTLGLKAFPCNLVNLLCQCVWSHLRDDSVTSKGTWAQLLSPNVLTPHCKVSCSAAFHLVNEIFFSVGFSIMLFAWHSSIKVLQYTADMHSPEVQVVSFVWASKGTLVQSLSGHLCATK